MFDVAVVGAGPAGAWAACLLARSGATVAILDGSHPREKPCGGGLTGRALAVVSAVLPAASFPAVPIRAARFVDAERDGSYEVALDQNGAAALVVADRRTFDARLLDAACNAGAELIPARVTGVSRDRSGFDLATARQSVRARQVVGADGANSFVRRVVAAPLPRPQLSIATGFFVRGETSSEIVIELVADPPGYLWSFPRPDHLAVGICAQADAGVPAGSLRERAAQWIRLNGLAPNGQLEPYAWPIPSLGAASLKTAPLRGPDWLLIGDAAGLVDPITREGIYFALRSGELAARAICRSDLAQYETQVRSELVPELARAARLKAGFFTPRFTALTLEALRQSAAIRRIMADLIAGAQPYRGLRRRLLATGEARLAWRLVTSRLTGSRRAPALAAAGD